MPSNQYIIPIQQDHNLPLITILMRGHINIGTVPFVFFVVDDNILLFRYTIFLHVRLDILPRPISRGVIHIHHMIVLVLLLEYGVEIS